MSKISYLFGNISGLGAYFSKPIFSLKPWVQPVILSTINPLIGEAMEFKKIKHIAVRVNINCKVSWRPSFSLQIPEHCLQDFLKLTEI